MKKDEEEDLEEFINDSYFKMGLNMWIMIAPIIDGKVLKHVERLIDRKWSHIQYETFFYENDALFHCKSF